MRVETAPDSVVKKLMAWEREARELEAQRGPLRRYAAQCEAVCAVGVIQPSRLSLLVIVPSSQPFRTGTEAAKSTNAAGNGSRACLTA
jgi:hypothetical protein